MSRTSIAAAAAAALLALAGCATTQVEGGTQYNGRVPRPDRILVYPFATSDADVQLDDSPTVAAAWKLQGLTASSEQRDVGHAVANTLADSLVAKIQALGLPAERAQGPATYDRRRTLIVTGQFLAIDQGSRVLRVTIGLGAGRSNVLTNVQLSQLFAEGSRVIDEFQVDAKSGRRPGAAETMGAGAAAGTLAMSAAVTAAGAVGGEAFGTNVDDDARRTAEKVASMLSNYFAEQGWVGQPGQ